LGTSQISQSIFLLTNLRNTIIILYSGAYGAGMKKAIIMRGLGRVFYNALVHHADNFDIPEARTIMRREFIWAAAGKERVLREGLTSEIYRSNKKNI
jgi:hypothetical protein